MKIFCNLKCKTYYVFEYPARNGYRCISSSEGPAQNWKNITWNVVWTHVLYARTEGFIDTLTRSLVKIGTWTRWVCFTYTTRMPVWYTWIDKKFEMTYATVSVLTQSPVSWWILMNAPEWTTSRLFWSPRLLSIEKLNTESVVLTWRHFCKKTTYNPVRRDPASAINTFYTFLIFLLMDQDM